jgi:hypothetical protein
MYDLGEKSRLDSEFYNLITQSKYPYSQHLCFAHCLQKKIIKEYDCTLDFLPTLYNNESQCEHGTNLEILSTNDIFSREESSISEHILLESFLYGFQGVAQNGNGLVVGVHRRTFEFVFGRERF